MSAAQRCPIDARGRDSSAQNPNPRPRTTRYSARLQRSYDRRCCSLRRSMLRRSRLAAKHVDVFEHARGRRMTAAHDLPRLPFAAVRRAQYANGVGVADALQAAPEIGAYAAVVRILDDVAKLSIDDHPSSLAAELELVS